MLEMNNNIAKIDGSKGKYDNKVSNPSVRYGRNAVDNLYSYLEQPITNPDFNPAPILDFGLSENAFDKNTEKIEQFIKKNNKYLESLPPLEYEYRYMPNLKKGEVDTKAALGAAYEEMGKVDSLSIKELDSRFAPDKTFSSEALDINKDGKVDVAEYASSIIAADMLSKSDIPDFNNIDGTINKTGFDAVLAYTQKAKANAATALYSNIYNNYNLENAKKDFNP